jgi:hypothetical protein
VQHEIYSDVAAGPVGIASCNTRFTAMLLLARDGVSLSHGFQTFRMTAVPLLVYSLFFDCVTVNMIAL